LTDPEMVILAVCDRGMTDASAYHLWSLAEGVNGVARMQRAWNLRPRRPRGKSWLNRQPAIVAPATDGEAPS
jgi:hypothetical protein